MSRFDVAPMIEFSATRETGYGTVTDGRIPQDVARIALTSRLKRKQVSDNLGVGMSTLNKWISVHRDTDLVSKEDLSLMEGMKRQIEALKQKSEQGSMQTQGEAAEIVLEETLAAAFPIDGFVPVAKGVSGADVRQDVTGLAAVRSEVESHSIGWCHWGFAGGFAIYDKTAGDWLPGMQNAIMSKR